MINQYHRLWITIHYYNLYIYILYYIIWKLQLYGARPAGSNTPINLESSFTPALCLPATWFIPTAWLQNVQFSQEKKHNFTWTHKFVDPILYKQQLFFAGFSIREECFFKRMCCLLTANVIEIGKLPVPAARLDCWYYFRAIFWTHYLRFRHSLQWFECHSWVHKGEMNENHQQCSGCKNSGNWSPSVRIPIFWKPQIQGGLIAQRLGL